MFSLNLLPHTDRVNLVATNLWRSYSSVSSGWYTIMCMCQRRGTVNFRYQMSQNSCTSLVVISCGNAVPVEAFLLIALETGHIILILWSSGKEAVAWTDRYRVWIIRWSTLSIFSFFLLLLGSDGILSVNEMVSCITWLLWPPCMPSLNALPRSHHRLNHNLDVYVGNLLGPFASDESRLFSWASPFPLFQYSASYFHRCNVFSVSFLLYSMIYFFPSK